MKELKAVEILKENIRNCEDAIKNDSSNRIQEMAAMRKNQYAEALAELQELTQEKSCDGCSHSPTTSDNCWHCIRGVKQDHYTPKG